MGDKQVKAVGSIKGGVMEFRQRGDAVTREPIPPMTSEQLGELERRIRNLRYHYRLDSGRSEAFQTVLEMLRE